MTTSLFLIAFLAEPIPPPPSPSPAIYSASATKRLRNDSGCSPRTLRRLRIAWSRIRSFRCTLRPLPLPLLQSNDEGERTLTLFALPHTRFRFLRRFSPLLSFPRLIRLPLLPLSHSLPRPPATMLPSRTPYHPSAIAGRKCAITEWRKLNYGRTTFSTTRRRQTRSSGGCGRCSRRLMSS